MLPDMMPVTKPIGAEMRSEDIVELAKRYAAHRNLTVGTVSTYAANDGKWIGRLEAGAGCTLRKAANVVQWFSDRWPADLAWPSDIPRPSTSKKEVA